MTGWLAAPIFATGQVLSATHHLNALTRSMQMVADHLLSSPVFPFCGLRFADPPCNVWRGWLRHRFNTLSWQIECWSGGVATIKINDVVVGGVGGSGLYSGSIDLTSLGLTDGGHYPVEVSGSNFYVWRLNETTNINWPTLHAFVDGQTPTAAQWQALSDTVTIMQEMLTQIRPAFSVPPTGINPTPWAGSMLHQNRYLTYDITLERPWENDNEYVEAKIYINNVLIAVFRIGEPWGTPPPPPVYGEYVPVYRTGSHTFRGALDVENSDLGLNLSRGNFYRLHLTGERNDWWNGEAKVRPWQLHETPAGSPTITGWTPPPIWTHGDLIYGHTTVKRVQQLADGLAALRSAITCVNPTFQNSFSGDMYNVRRWRWLHYTNGENDQPRLQYTITEEQTVSLPTAYENNVQGWKVYDLESAAGLYPGMGYNLAGVQAAYEANDAQT